MKNLCNRLAVAVLAVIATTPGCSGNQQGRKEEKDCDTSCSSCVAKSISSRLTTEDRQILSANLSQPDIYKEIPADPITGSKETWKVERAGNLLEVYRGSDGIYIDGSRYGSW